MDFVGKEYPCTENAVEISEADGGDGSRGARMDEGEGEQSVMARIFVTPRVGDSDWREGDKGRQ